jgi:myosin heavy subunit
MDPVSIGIGAAIGVAVGVGAMFGSKSKADKLQKELEELKSSTGKQLSELKQKQSAAEKSLEEAKKKLEAAESTSKSKAGELEKTKAKLSEIESAKKAADAAVKSQSAARAEAEKARDEIKQKADKAQQLASDLEDKVKSAQSQAEKFKQEVSKVKKELESAQQADGAAPSAAVVAALDSAGVDMNKILEVLVKEEGQKAAVLADSNGIVVSAAGAKDQHEGVAATAQMLSRLGTQFQGMIPFGQVRSFSLGDQEKIVIAGRTFEISGETIALATFGGKHPTEATLDDASAKLKAALL